MDKIKVAFFGTSDRSESILTTLKDRYNLVLCVTKNDVLVGRHRVLKPVAVKSWAKKNNINLVTISTFRGKEIDDILSALKQAAAEYIVVADFSFIFPEPLIRLYDRKIINVHFSLLPKYRGASPVQFAILNGDEMSGITYHLTEIKMDTGDILHQIAYKMSGNETSGELYKLLFELASRELPEVIDKFHTKKLFPRKQEVEKASYTFSPSHPQSTFIYKEDAEINWKKSPMDIYRTVRAFDPWPVAWTKLKFLERNKKLWNKKLALRPGINNNFKIKLYKTELDEGGTLVIKKIQVEGKSAMAWEEFCNGYVVSCQ